MTRTALRRSVAALGAACAPFALHAQRVVVRDDGSSAGAAALTRAASAPHVVRTGTGALTFPRDSAVTASLIVLGRPTYLAGRVDGDVVVVGSDLYLRPGVQITGRAVAIGGTVVTTTLGSVAGETSSFRDDDVRIEQEGDAFVVHLRAADDPARTPVFQPTGIYGLGIPRYDRVDGLSLPVGAVVTLGDSVVEITPSVTYRSRLGVVDPGVGVELLVGRPVSVVGRFARDTRTNDAWIYSTLVNSLTTFFAGSDTRNYFRSDIGEARLVATIRGDSDTVEGYLGGRHERVTSITAAGNVWSVIGRHSLERMHRVNPLVEEGNLASVLGGGAFHFARGELTARLLADVEQGVTTPAGTADFTQVTLDGRIQLPTFGLQRLVVRGHAVATRGDTVPRARYAYLGGSGTLRTLDQLEEGGTALFYLENRYLIPITAVTLPLIGNPVLSLRDAFGAAGVGSLPAFQHEIGVGIGLSVLWLDLTTAVAGRRGTELGVGISLSR